MYMDTIISSLSRELNQTGYLKRINCTGMGDTALMACEFSFPFNCDDHVYTKLFKSDSFLKFNRPYSSIKVNLSINRRDCNYDTKLVMNRAKLMDVLSEWIKLPPISSSYDLMVNVVSNRVGYYTVQIHISKFQD